MMFGHLPGSYVTMTLTEKWWRRGLTPQEGKIVYACGILAGVGPDVDVLFAGLTEHRGSVVHTPSFWIVSAAGVALLAVVFRQRKRLLLGLSLAILIGAATHLVLDAIFVGVKVLYPLSSEYFRMRPPISLRYDNWLINYVLHPIFLTEIHAFVLAAMLWRYRRTEPSAHGLASFLRVNRGIAGVAVVVTALYLLNWYAGVG